jgi:hypothetical protein
MLCALVLFCLQIKRPSKYDAHTAMMLGPTTPDPTIDLRGLTMVKQAGVGGIGEMGMPITGRYERNWNTLYVGGLPMDWGEMQVRAFSQITSLEQFGSGRSHRRVFLST